MDNTRDQFTDHSRLDLRVRGLAPSATLAINERSNALRAQGRRIIKLGLGQSPFPVPARVVDALKTHAHEKDYLPVAGLPALREAVARYHQRVDGVDRSPEGVVIGPGSKELLFLLQMVHAAELVLPSPSWVSYAPQARLFGRPIAVLPTTFEGRYRITAAQLDAHCQAGGPQPRLLLLNYPGNPDGDTYTAQELEALADVARRHQIVVVSDEIYGELHHRAGHCSLARFYPEGTIISNGISKWCGAGGWRLGTMAFPAELSWLRRAVCSVASESFTSVSAPIQYAAITAFEQGPDILDYLERCRRVVSMLGAEAARRLRSAGARCHSPTGGFYLFADFEPLRAQLAARGVHSGAALCEAVLDATGVAFLPGECFLRPAQELSARLAYVDFDGSAAIEAARTPETFELSEVAAPTLEGIDALCEWLTADA